MTSLIWTPSFGRVCGISAYTQNLLSVIPDCKVIKDVSKNESLPSDTKLVSVQHEYSLFPFSGRGAARLYQKGVPISLTEHTVKKDGVNPFEVVANSIIVANSLSVPILQSRNPSTSVSYIPIGCDKDFPPRKKKREKVIGYFGFITFAKGFDSLIRSVKRLPDTNLVVYCSGPPESNKKWENILGDRIRFVSGYLPSSELRARIAKEVDILVYWHKEQGGYLSGSSSICMGLASGVPVLASRTSWFHDVKEATYQPRRLTDGIVRLLEDTKLQERIVGEAREYCETNNWESIGRRYQEAWGCS